MIARAKSNFSWGVNALVPSPAISHPAALANPSQNTLFAAHPSSSTEGRAHLGASNQPWTRGQKQTMPPPCSWQLHRAAHWGWAAAASTRSSSSEERPMPPTRCSRGRKATCTSPGAGPQLLSLLNGRREVQKAPGDAVTGAG